MNVCVFCSSAHGLAAPYRTAAERLGELIGRRGHTLVFGGYDDGLMGTAAHAARDAGARVVGVLPCRDGELPGREAFPCDELVEATGLADRKARMERLSDAFVALPGSYGTLDELYDVLAAEKLGGGDAANPRPVALLDVDGFFAPLVELHRRMVADGFMGAGTARLCPAFDDAEALMVHLEDVFGGNGAARA